MIRKSLKMSDFRFSIFSLIIIGENLSSYFSAPFPPRCQMSLGKNPPVS